MSENQIVELKNQLGVIFDRLTRIETKLSERCDTRSEWMDHLEKRVRQLEYDKYKVVGAATLLSLLAGNILKLLG